MRHVGWKVGVAMLLSAGCGGPKASTLPEASAGAAESATEPEARVVASAEELTWEREQLRHWPESQLALTHRVAPNDTLFGLAEQYYGDGKHWRRIFYANRKRLRDQFNLPVGLTLIIQPPPR